MGQHTDLNALSCKIPQMAGIYVHIPYCKKACHYCNFHFSTNTSHLNDFVDALLLEIALQKHYLPHPHIASIYLGGGTPSLLNNAHLEKIIDSLARHFDLSEVKEVTLEANPDDISAEKLLFWKTLGITRLSIGVQSFFDNNLQWMNRTHNAAQAKKSIQLAQEAGFEQLNIDLIYGLPNMSDDLWQQNIALFLDFDLPHLSAYCLTVEPQTPLEAMIRKGKKKLPDDEAALRQFEWLIDTLSANGYEHYEISNFARPGRYGLHNLSYWQGAPYLGLGPSAHSFNGTCRQWNISNNLTYIRSLRLYHKVPAEVELLSIENRFNETVMTRLRTSWGLSLTELESLFPQVMIDELKKNMYVYLQSGMLILHNDTLFLTKQGKMIADRLISDLMYVNEE